MITNTDIKTHYKYPVITTLVVLVGLGIILRIDPQGHIGQRLRIILGSIGLLFLPGYRITQCLFGIDEIDILERIAQSFAFSISVIPLLVFYLNLMSIKITALMVYSVVLGCIALCRSYLKWMKTPSSTSEENV